MIERLTLGKAESLGIPRRTYFDWKKKRSERKLIILKNKFKTALFSKHFENKIND